MAGRDSGTSSGGLLAGMDLPYQIAFTEKVRGLDDDLVRDLTELHNEIEENEMVHGIQKPVSSVPLPKDIAYFRRERELVIKRAMEVCEARPLAIQAELMRDELDSAGRSDYSPEALTLLLHQFFVERIGQLVQSKHLHMLRWKRFCEHTSTIEALYPHYSKRLTHIMSEYNDCLQRAQRLSVARESYLTGNLGNAVSAINIDDLMIYLRWLVCHLHAIKKFTQYLKALQWLPFVHKSTLSATKKEEKQAETDIPSHIPSRYTNDSFLVKLGSSRASSSSSSTSGAGESPPSPPVINPLLLSTTPMPISQFAYAAAASGGGLASDEHQLHLPVNMNDLDSLRPHLNFLAHLYSISVDVNQINTSADEMELYATVTRKFKQIFTRQEHMKTFKTYDRIDVGQESWGADCSMHAMKQEANWLNFIKIKPEKDPRRERKMVELRSQDKVDELLRVMSRFLSVEEPEKIQDALREHALAVREPVRVQPVSVQSNKSGMHTGNIWKRIYTNADLFNKSEEDEDMAMQEFDEKEADNVNFNPRSRATSARKRRDSYDYKDTVQLLGLDEGDQDSNDPASLQGAYLSFLQLRHLRIRDLHRTCLSILNYFRSVERTLTINDGGLSLESGKMKTTSPQDHRRNVVDSGSGGGGGLPSHQYIHNTPRDFKIAENEFMEFSDIENHDDFYTLDEGRVHVQDQRGYYIMYDAAINDFKQLEKDLLLIATSYIEKDRDRRNATGIIRPDLSSRRSPVTTGDFDIASYSHQEVDRFGILLDLWSSEAGYLECKKELLDCYVEAYHHIVDRDEKRGLAQVITNIMYRRPRFDFEAAYFVRCYRLECVCLRLESNLIKTILDSQIEEQREYIQRVCRDGDAEYGLPHKIIPKQPIAINMCSNEDNPNPRSALKNIYMMEFHPSLSMASRIPEALKHAHCELYHAQKPTTATDMILLDRRLLETAQKEWDNLPAMGSGYSLQVQKDLFSDVFVEDPLFITEIAHTLVHQEDLTAGKSPKEKQALTVQAIGRLMEGFTSRFRLMELAWESEILAKLYRKQATEMGYDECHYFLRFVQFEFANFKQDAGKPPPVFIQSIQEDDSGIDRFIPNYLFLAIHELDESHVGRFSFRSRDGILQLMRTGGVESLQTSVMCQVVHKNAMMAAVQQATACQQTRELPEPKTARPASPPDAKSEKSSEAALPSASQVNVLAGKISSARDHKQGKTPEAFVSLQLEKGPSRDLMLNEFVNKKNSMGMILKKQEEMEKLKRKLISDYCYRFNQRSSQYSLRSQIISYYNSILGLLEEFPNIRDTYFMLGEPNEKKTEMDGIKGLEPDPRSLRRRPRRVISYDGKHVLNLWFIPHYTEVLIMFKTMDDLSCQRALTHCLRIVSALHDMLQYLCAHSRMGSSHARLGTKKVEFVSADWGGTEGIGADLREIQHQIDNLDMKTDPERVCQFLTIRRDVMFLEFDAAVRHSMRDTFLATGNVEAFNSINSCMHFALHFLSNSQHPCLDAIYLNVPEPLEARDPIAKQLYPWRTFLNRNGPYGTMFWQWSQIEGNLQLCLSGLKAVDRHVANGEILGVSLLLEDVLTMGQHDRAIMMKGLPDEEDTAAAPAEGSVPPPANALEGRRNSRDSTPSSTRPSTALGGLSRSTSLASLGGRRERSQKRTLSKTDKPIESYILLRSFLLLWKRLEVCKNYYGCLKLGVEKIETVAVYKSFCKEYRKDVLYPVLSSTARRYGQADMYEGMVSEDEPLIVPKGASEVEIRMRQLIKLLEMIECNMITELHKRIARELNLVFAERAREESALPTDLWKKPVIKESFTMNKPRIAEAFIEKLMSESSERDNEVTFSLDHLNSCLSTLATEIMLREKHNYDSYSMFYESLLRVHHQRLYQREQEVKQVTDKLAEFKASIQTQVQCELADTNQSLLLEVTALRAKIAEMRQTLMTQENVVREHVRQEYDELVQNLFSSAFDLKRKFDVFREELYGSVYKQVSETRGWAIEAMTTLKQKSGSGKDEEETRRNLAHANQMHNIEEKNNQLNILMTKMKAMNNWKQTRLKGTTQKKQVELQRDSERSKKLYLEVKLLAEEEVILLRQQVLALRNALRTAELESADIKLQLDKELRSKKEKLHAAQQNAQSQKQLEDARKANIEKLLDELEDKDVKLRSLNDDQDRMRRLQQLMHDKIKKDVSTIRKQLTHERNLKLDAFQRVDELQTTVYDMETFVLPSRAPTAETPMPSRPQTALAVPSSGRSRSRISSGRHSRTTSMSGGVWPPPVPWPHNRSITPAPDFYGGSNNTKPTNNEKKIQRPKTTLGRLRSRIADQLLNELDPPDHHETLIRLQELKAQQVKEAKQALAT